MSLQEILSKKIKNKIQKKAIEKVMGKKENKAIKEIKVTKIIL